jgi:hypothetical protein
LNISLELNIKKMSEASNNTQAVFMEITTKKIEVQDKKIDAMQETIKDFPDNTELIQSLISNVNGLQDTIKKNNLPLEKMQQFTAKLDNGIRILRHPVETKVIHHHHIPKLIWVTVGLFIALSLVCAGWYVTGNKLDSYIANDTKYRYLRINTAEKGLHHYLDRVDSLGQSNINLRETVLKTEEKNREDFERLQKAERLKAEVRELENKVKKNK